MHIIVSPSRLKGKVKAPPSKSMMQRACAASLIRDGEIIIHNIGISNDDKAAIRIIEQLGAITEIVEEHTLKISVNNHLNQKDTNPINCGESGLAARMFIPISTIKNKEIIITGSGSLLQRPFDIYEKILPQLGIETKSNSGRLPIHLKGALHPKNICIDGALSSQFITGLIMAFAASNACDITITTKNLQSKPYIDMTLQVMKDFGLKTPINNNYESFYFDKTNPLPSVYTLIYTIEGDWSSAAMLLVAGALNSDKIIIEGIDPSSTQSDKRILEVLEQSGCKVNVKKNIILVNSTLLKSFDFDANDSPDLFPPLVALALFCEGTSNIKGVSRLYHKESNRLESLQAMCHSFGADILIKNDTMMIQGKQKLKPAIINTFNDHRIAMAATIIAMNISGNTIIENADCISKSYPHFYKDLIGLGADIKMI